MNTKINGWVNAWIKTHSAELQAKCPDGSVARRDLIWHLRNVGEANADLKEILRDPAYEM